MFAPQVAKRRLSRPDTLPGSLQQPARSGPGRSAPASQANRGVLPRFLQAQLKVGRVNDPLESEADAVADQVLRASPAEPAASASVPQISRKCAACEQEEQLQLKAAGPETEADAPAPVHEELRAPGAPLDAATRALMEPRFGLDFSQVRVHTGSSAAQSAQLINAHAYTVGQDIVFDAGRFAPATHEGRRLLAHELTHVAQQSRPGMRRIPPGKGAVGNQAGTGSGAAGKVSRQVGPTVQRQHDVTVLLHPEEVGTFRGYFVLPSNGGEFHYRVELDNVTPLSLDPQYRSKLDTEIEFGMRTVMLEALSAKVPLGLLPPLTLNLSPGYSAVLQEGHLQRVVERAARAELRRMLASERQRASVVLGAVVKVLSVETDYIGDISPFGDMLPGYYSENKIITDRDDLDLLQAWFEIANGKVTGSRARARISAATNDTARYVTLLSGTKGDAGKLPDRYQSQVDELTRNAAREEVNEMTKTAVDALERPETPGADEAEEERILGMTSETLAVVNEFGEAAHRVAERYTTGEQTERLHELLKERFDENMREYIREVFSGNLLADEPQKLVASRVSDGGFFDGLTFIKGGLDTISTIMRVKDPKARAKLFDAHPEYFAGQVAHYTDIGTAAGQFLSGAATCLGAAAYGALRISGKTVLAEQVLDTTVKYIGNIAGPVALLSVVHGVSVLLDPDASAEEKSEAALETTTGTLATLGFAARWAPRLGVFAEWGGPIGASLTINYYLAKRLLEAGYQAQVGMTRLDWALCYNDTQKALDEVQFWMRQLVATVSLLAVETDPYRQKALENAADGARYGLLEQIKAFVEARLSAKSREDDISWCGPAFGRRLLPMPALLNDAGSSNEAAVAAGGTFLAIVAHAMADWDHIIMEKQKSE